jgi:hypothetical protein
MPQDPTLCCCPLGEPRAWAEASWPMSQINGEPSRHDDTATESTTVGPCPGCFISRGISEVACDAETILTVMLLQHQTMGDRRRLSWYELTPAAASSDHDRARFGQVYFLRPCIGWLRLTVSAVDHQRVMRCRIAQTALQPRRPPFTSPPWVRPAAIYFLQPALLLF